MAITTLTLISMMVVLADGGFWNPPEHSAPTNPTIPSAPTIHSASSNLSPPINPSAQTIPSGPPTPTAPANSSPLDNPSVHSAPTNPSAPTTPTGLANFSPLDNPSIHSPPINPGAPTNPSAPSNLSPPTIPSSSSPPSSPENPSAHTNPSVSIRVPRKGIDHFLKSIIDLAQKYSSKISIPDVNKTENSNFRIATANMRITSFPVPTVNYTLIAPNQCHSIIKFPGVGVEGIIYAARDTYLNTQEDTGYVVFNITNILSIAQIRFGKFDNGYPKLDDIQCETLMEDADVKITGAKEKFFVEMLDVVPKILRPAYNMLGCLVAKKLAFSQINHFLSQLPSNFNVSRNVAINFHVDNQIHPEYIDMHLFGRVNNDLVNHHPPAPFEETPTDDSLLRIFISDAMYNDVCYHMYANNQFDLIINDHTHELLYPFVQLKCKSDLGATCLGNAVPQLAKEHGSDALVEVKIKATKAPEIVFTKDKAAVSYPITVNIYVPSHNANGQATTTPSSINDNPVITANVNLEGSLQVTVVNGQLVGTVTTDQVHVQVTQPNYKAFEDKIGVVVKHLVEEKLYKRTFQKPLPLNLPPGFNLEKPQLKFLQNTLEIQSSFVFEPQFYEDHQNASGKIVEGLTKGVQSALTDVKNEVTSAITDVWNTGSQTIAGIKNGVQSTITDVVGKWKFW